jgi:hypothetical protein
VTSCSTCVWTANEEGQHTSRERAEDMHVSIPQQYAWFVPLSGSDLVRKHTGESGLGIQCGQRRAYRDDGRKGPKACFWGLLNMAYCSVLQWTEIDQGLVSLQVCIRVSEGWPRVL